MLSRPEEELIPLAYDPFISYSHAADGRLATGLQLGLRSFAKLQPLRLYARGETFGDPVL